ncbi:nitrile hydratase subunit beta [Candidatus Entotheonella palauensis]|uniref:nitrile hydratase subunit beta n=1 Tax=Candidatus Entotheonella palauensis TaxID=93172 RepID=UPI000B7E59A7|nr:nitrile hydratase subunit beta [Candidatus Entotheonella palauensis]
MNGIHDMGGMHGFGPVKREDHEPVFHHEWEGRVFGMFIASQVPVPEGKRYKIETMDPQQYITSSYYERWMQACIQACMDAGVLTADDLEARMSVLRDHPGAASPRAEDPERLDSWQSRIRAPRSIRRESNRQPQFAVGDAVRARNIHPVGHTRLPRYVRGQPGVITRFYGFHDVQDHLLPPGTDAPPEPVYAVRFEAQTLWGNAAESNGALYIDMWERYLEPAPEMRGES